MTVHLTDLPVPLVQAPMAGGPSTVALAAAVGAAGGLGMLAAGYKTASAMVEEIERLEPLTSRYGVNLFVPEQDPSAPADLAFYARALVPLATERGVPAPAVGEFTDDAYSAKMDYLVSHPVPLVSFTFGLPPAAHVARLQEGGTTVALHATSEAEAAAAARLRPDCLVVQGTEAGGHRAIHGQAVEPEEITTTDLVTAVRRITDLPLIAAGGVSGREDAAALLGRGAQAVQVGTLFLTTREAGTRPAHREALLDGAARTTTVTRAFSGRPARALRNRFTERLETAQVVGYPEVNQMTAELRAASSDDAQGLNLWAGTGWRACRPVAAKDVVEQFRGL